MLCRVGQAWQTERHLALRDGGGRVGTVNHSTSAGELHPIPPTFTAFAIKLLLLGDIYMGPMFRSEDTKLLSREHTGTQLSSKPIGKNVSRQYYGP